jgi:hypothetical protein
MICFFWAGYPKPHGALIGDWSNNGMMIQEKTEEPREKPAPVPPRISLEVTGN